jgi:hypothetical protein
VNDDGFNEKMEIYYWKNEGIFPLISRSILYVFHVFAKGSEGVSSD